MCTEPDCNRRVREARSRMNQSSGPYNAFSNQGVTSLRYSMDCTKYFESW